MLIIGLGNRARQGKDVATSAILDFYRDRLSVQRIGFADALYEVCREEYGMVEKDAPLLQQVGVERREIDPEYWIKRAFSKINPKSEIVIIPDTRFLNEAQSVKKAGGYIVNVTRLNQDGSRYFATDRPKDHISETELDNYNFDFRLVNSANHEALLGEQAITLCEYLRSLHE